MGQTAKPKKVGFATTEMSAINAMLRVTAWLTPKDPVILEVPIVAVVPTAVAPAAKVDLVEAVPEDVADQVAPNEVEAGTAIPMREWDVVSVQKRCAPIP